MTKADPIAIARELIRCRSVTPVEGGALSAMETRLADAGFSTHRVVFSDEGTPDVDNLYARIGTKAPCLVFAGHTDVVPPGDEAAWRAGPFEGVVENGELIGRGAVDMKGGLACALAATIDFLAERGPPKGSIAFLITGDEEGPSINGTVKLLDWARARGERFDHCILGEPTNTEVVGDMIKNGRRGSLSAILTARGRQGHVAYPHLAANPIPPLMGLLTRLTSRKLDAGNAHFDASNLEITSVDVGNGATNVIPAEARARLNIRFNDEHTGASLKAWIEAEARAKEVPSVTIEVTYARGNSEAFVTKPGPFVDMVREAITAATGRTPKLSTFGGTSDARFIKDHCPVIEFGLVGKTMHMVDERVPVEDLRTLAGVYRGILDRYFALGSHPLSP